MRITSTLSVALAVTLAGCQSQPQPLSEDASAAIRAVDESYVAGVRTQNWDALVAVFTPEVVYMPPNRPAVVGRPPNLTRFQARDWESVEYVHTIIDITAAAGVANVYGSYSVSIHLAEVDEPVTDRGKYLSVLLRQPNGEWLIDKMIWNSDQPR